MTFCNSRKCYFWATFCSASALLAAGGIADMIIIEKSQFLIYPLVIRVTVSTGPTVSAVWRRRCPPVKVREPRLPGAVGKSQTEHPIEPLIQLP